ncbi:glycosyl hydrolase [Hyaloscypha finlandica]|nr:glycosyl hydrolase [Hyaloscypha finlandica]
MHSIAEDLDREYLFCYQWNPGTTQAGNCAWGMAKSKDLITWEDCSPALRNGRSYDYLGLSSGSIVSGVVEGKRVLFLFYTSVSALPIHWSKPYLDGCETQSVAFSTDLGKSWHRHENNPLLRVAPKNEARTGWRDPFVSTWEALSTLLGADPETDFMMIASGSSGKRGHGPQLQLCQSNNIFDWKPLCMLLDVKANSKVSPTSELKFGMNFDCASFFSIGERQYIVLGIEEDNTSQRHSTRYLLWLSGILLIENGRPIFQIRSHGLLDHGIAYAAHVFRDADGKITQLGWADEAAKRRVVERQGWAGCLTHPRELYEISRPVANLKDDRDRWDVDEALGTMTLGIRLAPQVTKLRAHSQSPSLESLRNVRSMNYEIEATFTRLSGNEKFIFNVRQSPNSIEVTKVVFDIGNSQIIVDRSRSSLESLGSTCPDAGRFHLLSGEDLNIRIFVDNSILEVYANDCFALTSRIYPSLETSLGASYDFGGFDERQVEFRCWEGIRNAWPGR